jgi:hypothetical protein
MPKFNLPQKNTGMNKSKHFSGQPVMSQIIKLIPRQMINYLVRRHNCDYYYKRFRTYDHLVTMLYCCMHDCTSLREVTTGLQAHYNKFGHLNLKCIPRRSTLSDSNKRRNPEFFEDLYNNLYQLYYGSLPDSLAGKRKEQRLFIMDSTTISLYADILKGAGCYAANGKKKGGAKAHVLLNAENNLPQLINLSAGSRNDRIFMDRIQLPKGAILVFDRGYHKFSQWDDWNKQGISWVTRLINNEVFEVLNNRQVSDTQKQKGVLDDQIILLGRGTNASTKRIQVRLITYQDNERPEPFLFLTNNLRFNASTIASLYKQRWQIEIFFKRFKQNNPVKYFLGDNENAIKIQLWTAFIKDLLIKIIKDKVRRKWSYANLSSMVRHHLMNYINIFKFLNDPDKAFIKIIKQYQVQAALFPT